MKDVISVSKESKKLFGRPIDVIRVTVTSPPDKVREARERAKAVTGGVKDVLEADIRFTLRYMIDKGIKPGWVEYEVEEGGQLGRGGVEASYRALGDPVQLDSIDVPHLKYVAWI